MLLELLPFVNLWPKPAGVWMTLSRPWVPTLVMSYGCVGTPTYTHLAESLMTHRSQQNSPPSSHGRIAAHLNCERTKYDHEPLSPRQSEKLGSSMRDALSTFASFS